MHGQKRSEYKSRLLHTETSLKLATKAKQWNHLNHELLTQHRRLLLLSSSVDGHGSSSIGKDDDDIIAKTPPPSPAILLSLTEKMLSVNPDPSHLWNIRRELLLLQPLLQTKKETKDDDDDDDDDDDEDDNNAEDGKVATAITTFNIDKQLQEELKLIAHCLQRNPKSYATWHHRKWSIALYLTHTNLPSPLYGEEEVKHPKTTAKSMEQEVVNDTDTSSSSSSLHMMVKQMLTSEIELVTQFLLLDERNFHCWNYRRFIVALLGTTTITTDTKQEGESTSIATNDGASSTSSSMHNLLPLLYSGSWSSWWHNNTTNEQPSMGSQLLPKCGSITTTAAAAAATTAKVTSSSSPSSTIFMLPTTATSIQELSDIIHMEYNFTTTKIYDNFSNGSAFHYRSKLLPLLLECKLLQLFGNNGVGGNNTIAAFPVTIITANIRYKEMLTLARSEWEDILLNAIYTEPDDQTPWWYHRFIVSWVKPPTTSSTQQSILLSSSSSSTTQEEGGGNVDDELVQEYETFLFEMIDSLRELLEVEKENDDNTDTPNQRDESKGAKCKWAYIGLHMVLSTLLLESKTINDQDTMKLREEADECLNELTIIDPNRKERYQQLRVAVKM